MGNSRWTSAPRRWPGEIQTRRKRQTRFTRNKMPSLKWEGGKWEDQFRKVAGNLAALVKRERIAIIHCHGIRGRPIGKRVFRDQ